MQSRGLTATAAAVARAPATGTIDDLAAHRHTLVVTFRRDGTPVATPVWGALAGGAVYVRAERDSGKVKRLRGDGRALLAPCSARGHALGPALEARGRVLAAGEEGVAEDALARRYGTVRALFEQTMDVMRVDMCYLELAAGTPR